MSKEFDLSSLATRFGLFPVEAYIFVGEGLQHATRNLGKDQEEGIDRHITALELVDGILELAANRYGLLATQVLSYWSLTRSEDIGKVTFHLIEEGLFGKQASDTLDDFNGGTQFPTLIYKYTHERLIHPN
ncbi:MAG: hypothetical protein HRU15_11595 [Planctomycetes bacterium]|nr:hypothetical protein [Planctomycetota bacterium]